MVTAQPPDTESSRSPIGRVLVVLAVLAIVLFWAWILSGAPAKKNPDYLRDRGWVDRASEQCETAVEAIGELPAAAEASTPAERAKTIVKANGVLERLVADLRADRVDTADDRRVAGKWLDDWEQVLQARREYATKLAEADVDGDEALPRLLLPENQRGDGLDRVITNFADVNDMPACGAPGDIG